jgi:iron complex transport system substrate-binding protein
MVDDLGRTVQLPVSPKRVVTLAPSLTEVVFAAGAGDRLIAVTTADDYPPAVEELDRIGAFPLNHEAVVARSPDLVLAADQVNSPLDLEPISDLDIPVFFFRFTTASEVISSIRTVGEIMGTRSAAGRAADSLEARWMSLDRTGSGTEEGPRLLLLVGYEVLYAFGGESYTVEMVRRAGARPVTRDLIGQSAVLSDEFVVARAPEIIVVASKSSVSPEHLLEHHPAWDVVPAIRSGHVYTIDPDLVLRPGPRIVDGTEALARLVDAVRGGPRQ